MTAANFLIPNFGSKFHCFHEEHAIARSKKKNAKISVGVWCYLMSEATSASRRRVHRRFHILSHSFTISVQHVLTTRESFDLAEHS